MTDPEEEDSVPLVIPMRDPGPPPPIPIHRRLVRLAGSAWSLLVWAGAVTVALWLYFSESWHGHALAYADILELRVSPALSGRLVSLQIEVGQLVREGDPIASLDARDLEARIRLARTEVDRLRTRVAAEREALKLDRQDRQAQAAARRRAYEAEGLRLQSERDKLLAAQTSDRAEIESLAPSVNRLKPLLDKRLITADRLEEFLQRRTLLEKRSASREESIRQTRDEITEWGKLDPGSLPDPDLDVRLLPFELELKGQEARVAELELDRGKYAVQSPGAGTVHMVSARPGEWLNAGAEIAQIVVPRPGRVIAYVTDRQVPAVMIGTLCTLRPRDHGGPALEGRVILAGPRIEQVPMRLRFIPTVAQWGRLVTIQVERGGDALPGEIYDVRFHR